MFREVGGGGGRLAGGSDEGLFDALGHRFGFDADFSAEEALHALGFSASEVAFGAFGAEHFAGAGDVEALFCAFMGFEFGHCSIMQYAPVRVTNGRVLSTLGVDCLLVSFGDFEGLRFEIRRIV